MLDAKFNSITLDEIREELTDRLKFLDLDDFVTIDINGQLPDITLDRIQVTEEHKGYGTAGVQTLVDLCDQLKINLNLTVRPLNESHTAEWLVTWYRKFNFSLISSDSITMARAHRSKQ